jgi:hypothetical protein
MLQVKFHTAEKSGMNMLKVGGMFMSETGFWIKVQEENVNFVDLPY